MSEKKNPKDIFMEEDSTYRKFEDVEVKMSSRPDLHAFIILNELDPGNKPVLASAGHDEVWLGFDPDVAFENMTVDQAKDLKRCGVMYSEEYDSFSMFA